MFRKFVFILLFAGSYAFLWDSKTKLHCIFSKYMLNYFELNESYFLSNVQQNSKRIYDHLSLEKYGENLQKQGIIVMAMLDELRNQKYPKIADDLMTVNLYINNITGNIMLYSTDRSEQGNELAADDSRIRIGFSNVYKMIIEELKLFYYSECKQKFGTCLTKIDSRFEKLRVESKELKTLKESSSPSTISDYLDVMVKNAEEAFKTNIEDKTYEDFHPSNMVLLKLMNDSSKDDEVFFPDKPLEHLKYVNINEEYNVFLFSLFEKIKSSFHVSSLKSYQQQVIAAALYPIFSCTSSYVRMFKQLYITKKGGKYATEINKLGNKLIKIFGKLFNKSFLPFKVGKYIHDITEKLLYIASYYSLQQSGMTVNWINFFLSLLSKPMKLNRIVYDSSTTVLDKISKLQCEILIEETESKIRDTLEYTKALIRNVDPFVILRRSVNHEDMFQKGPLDVLNTPTIRTIYYYKYISAEECSNISNRPSRQASNMGKDLTIGLAGALPFEVTIPDISINIIRRPSSASENERRKTRDENMGGSSLGIIDSNIHAGRSPNVSVDQPSRRSTFKGKKRIDPTLDGMPSTSTIIPKSSRDDGLEKMDGSDDDEYNRIQSLIISEKNKNEPTAGNARRVGTRSDDDQYPNSRSKNIKLKGKLEFDESIDDDSSNASEIFETAERDLMLDEIKKAYQELKKSNQHDYDRRTQSDSEIMKGQEIRRETKKSWYIESSETFDGENTSYKTHKIKYTSRETSGNNSSNKPNTPVSAEDLLHELETRNIPADHTRDRDESPRSIDSTEQKKPISPQLSGEKESEKNKKRRPIIDLNKSAKWSEIIQEDDQQYENYPGSSSRSNEQNYKEMRADSDGKDGNEITDADDKKDDLQQEPHKVKTFKNILEQKISALPKSIEGESSSKKGKKKIDPRSSDELDGKKTIDSKHRSRRASIDGESLPRQHLSSPKSSGKRKIDSLSSDELDGLGLNNRERGSVDSTEQKKPMSPRSSGETESEKNKRQHTTKDLPTRRSAELLKKIQEDDQQFENYPRKPSINNEQNYREMRADSDRKEGNEINDADDIQQEPHKVKTFKNIFEQKIAALSQSIEEESSSKKGKKKIDPRSSDELDGKQPIDSKHLSRRMSIDWESLPRQFPLSPKTSRNDKTLEDSLRLYENRSRQSSKNIGPFATPIKKDDERLHKKKSEINYEHGKTNLKNQRDLGDHHSENSFHSENYSNRRPYIRKHDGDSTSLHCLFSEYLLGYLDLNERYFVAIHKNNDANLTYYDTNLRFLSEFILAMLDELRNYNKNPFAFDLMTINLYLNNLANDLSIISSDITTMQFNDAESHRHKLVVNYDIMTKGLFNFLRSNCLSYSPDAFETRFQDVYQTVRALDEKKAVKNARILMRELQKLKFRAYASWKPTLDRDQHDDFHPTNMLFYDLMSGYLKRDESAKPTRKVLDFRRKRHADSAKFDDGLQAIRDVVISTSRRGGSHNNIIAAFYCVSLNFNAEYVTSFQQQVLAATIHPVFSCIAEYITAFKNILYVFKHDATHVNDIVEFGVVLSETFGKFIHLNLFSNKVSVYLEKVLRRLRDVIHSKNKEMITEILSLCKKPMELNRLEFGRDKNVIETIVQEKERKLLAHTNALILSTVAYVEALSTHRHIFDVIKRSVPHNDMFETEPLDVFRACDSGYETDE